MSIRRNRNRDRQNEAVAEPLIQPTTPPPRIERRKPNERNGYLDPDQTLVNFAIREKGMTFEQLIAEDPSRLLRTWLKLYRKARATAIATAVLGAAATVVGVGVGATPLMVAGIATIGGSGMLAKHHNAGVKACELEAEILDEIRPILELFHTLETRGANPSDLVSLYDRLIRQYAAQNPVFGAIGDPAGLKEFFEVELAKHLTVSSVAATQTGFAAAAKPQPPAIAPAAPPPVQPPSPSVAPVIHGQPEAPIAQSAHESSTEIQVATEIQTVEAEVEVEVPTTDLAGVLAEQLKSLVIAAFPRTGKGITVAHGGRRVKEMYPDLEIWLLDPKNEASESGYWSFVDLDKRIHFDLRDFCLDIPKTETLVNDFLTRFNNSTAVAKLLIVDEFVALNARLSSEFMKRLKDFLVAISSSGESSSGDASQKPQGKFAWVITQSPYVADLGFRTKGQRAAFNRILLFNDTNQGYLTLAEGADFCPKIRDEEKQKLLSSTGRAFYYSLGDRWGAICNYQGFAPDARTSPNSHPFSAQPVVNQQATEAEVEVATEEVATAVFDTEEIAAKLLNWLKGRGQEFFTDGFISGPVIVKNFGYWNKGKTYRVSKPELTQLVMHLVHIKEVEVVAGKGVRLLSFEDELGLFDDVA